jgi:amino acid permease
LHAYPAALAVPVLLMVAEAAGAVPVVFKTHLVALGMGKSIPSVHTGFINEYSLRFVDAAVGTRVAPQYAVAVRFTLGERLMSYYSIEPFFGLPPVLWARS